MSFKAQTIVVTGANRGLGLEFVEQLSLQKDNIVFATARSAKDATKLNDLAKQRGNITVVELDVNSVPSIEALVSAVSSKSDHVNLLINNAGIYGSPEGTAVTATQEDLRSVLDTNTIAPVLTTQRFLPLLKKAKSADSSAIVVFISSLIGSHSFDAAKYGFKGIQYSVSKAALNMVNTEFARQVEDVQFLSLHPGHVQTDMGGASAPMEKNTSINAMLSTIAKEAESKQTGRFLNYDGEVIAY